MKAKDSYEIPKELMDLKGDMILFFRLKRISNSVFLTTHYDVHQNGDVFRIEEKSTWIPHEQRTSEEESYVTETLSTQKVFDKGVKIKKEGKDGVSL